MIDISALNFEKSNGLIPCIVQDSISNRVLMLGYMNQQALMKTLELKKVTFFSRSKNRLWTKGENSGNYLELVDIREDCDRDVLLIHAVPNGPVCHKGSDTCFGEPNVRFNLKELEAIIRDRIVNPKEGSYTNKLLNQGINKIAQKVGEEAVELVIESKEDNKEQLLNEAADLIYHFLLLINNKGATLEEVTKVLHQRHSQSKT